MNYKKGKVTKVFKDGFVYIQENKILKMFSVIILSILLLFLIEQIPWLGVVMVIALLIFNI